MSGELGDGKVDSPSGAFLEKSGSGQEHGTRHIYLIMAQSHLLNSTKHFEGLECNPVAKDLPALYAGPEFDPQHCQINKEIEATWLGVLNLGGQAAWV